MKKLTYAILSFTAFMAGCATNPKIIGTWTVQSPNNLVGVDRVEIFKDGTVLATSTEDETAFLLNWSKTEGKYMITAPDDTSLLVVLPDRDLMIWKEQNGDDYVTVLRRKPKFHGPI